MWLQYRTIFRWLTAKNLSALDFDTDHPTLPEKLLSAFKSGNGSYARAFEYMARCVCWQFVNGKTAVRKTAVYCCIMTKIIIIIVIIIIIIIIIVIITTTTHQFIRWKSQQAMAHLGFQQWEAISFPSMSSFSIHSPSLSCHSFPSHPSSLRSRLL